MFAGNVIPSKTEALPEIKTMQVFYRGCLDKYARFLPELNKNLNESVVTAVAIRDVALLFAAEWDDNEITFARFDGIWYVVEMKPGAFDLFQHSGWIHTMAADQFKADDRVKLVMIEFVSYNPVDVISAERIPDIYTALLDKDFRFIKYGDPPEWPDKYCSSYKLNFSNPLVSGVEVDLFSLLESGVKTIEGRPWIYTFRDIHVGDTINITMDCGKKIKRRVIFTHVYPNVKIMLEQEGLDAVYPIDWNAINMPKTVESGYELTAMLYEKPIYPDVRWLAIGLAP